MQSNEMSHIDEFEEPTYVEPYKYDDTMVGNDDRLEMQPVHEADITDSGVIAAVRRAYRDTQPNKSVTADGSRRLKFTSAWHNVHDMDTLWAIGFIGEYNAFTPEYVQWFVSSLDGTKTKVAIGREGSPVLYFWTIEPYTLTDGLKRLSFYPSLKRSSWGPSAPDELSVRFGCTIYPTLGMNSLPDDIETGEVVWEERSDTEEERERLKLHEETDSPCLIRAWWD